LDVKLISAFGAADMLELGRQTVRRALRKVSPDVTRKTTAMADEDDHRGH
jgi:hypothetical protein